MKTTSCRNIRLHIMDQIWSGPSSETAYSQRFVLVREFFISKETYILLKEEAIMLIIDYSLC